MSGRKGAPKNPTRRTSTPLYDDKSDTETEQPAMARDSTDRAGSVNPATAGSSQTTGRSQTPTAGKAPANPARAKEQDPAEMTQSRKIRRKKKKGSKKHH